MAWQPKNKVISARAIPQNLLTFVLNESRQKDALVWAGGSGLKVIRTLEQRIATPSQPLYPAIAFVDDNDEQDFTKGDNIAAVYSMTFQIGIQNSDKNKALEQARIYSKALNSMIANCPNETVLTGTGAYDAILISLETGFLRIKAGKDGTAANDFLQEFQIRVAYALMALWVG